MTILRRILRFLPVAVVVVLVAGWMLSHFFQVEAVFGSWIAKRHYILSLSAGTVAAYSQDYEASPLELRGHRRTSSKTFWSLGQFRYFPHYFGGRYWSCPVLCLVTALLPFAVGALTGFRFRLWQWLAYTALVAVQLAYFLQWQA